MIKLCPHDSLIRLLNTHLYQLRSQLPVFAHDALALRVIEILRAISSEPEIEKSRVLHSAIVVAAMLKDSSNTFLFDQLSRIVSRSGSDVFAREEHDRTQLWTLILRFGEGRLPISIGSLDGTRSSQIACLALATFIKAFEPEFRTELPIGQPSLTELNIQIATYQAMPDTLREAVDKLNVRETLERGDVVVTRPTTFEMAVPTHIILDENFSANIKFGELQGGGLQALFGRTLVEIVFQLLRGEVDDDTIRSKVVSLVRRTL